MLWQDVVFMAGSLLSVVFLVPALRDAAARIPVATSRPKMALGAVYAATFATMGMPLAAVGLLATGVMWGLLAAYRSPRATASPHTRHSVSMSHEGKPPLAFDD
ncbi:hypothetical protein [Natrinema versiforme]|uniref:Uncharacterized protein n=1 Tax=Natrinema versiforme TaxID=88724 RepID=A0A4P8WKX4_9EURY|nr:hypothetical protein [Natrinema versiforme]QCS44140.1 hypothetical protein FEJ81_18010 [Natrinema versiforme]